jgi:hypothetical protein
MRSAFLSLALGLAAGAVRLLQEMAGSNDNTKDN